MPSNIFKIICSKTLLGAVLLALSFALLPASAAQAGGSANVSPHPMFIETVSPANLPTTVNAFLEEVRAAGWSNLGTTNMAGILSERGFTLDPVLILHPCSGRLSAQLLDNDETRFVSSMIPCRVAIYQTSDDRVIISRINSAAMAKMMPSKVADIMASAGTGVEEIIAATLVRLRR